MHALTPALVLFSVLFPSKLWFAPNQALMIEVKSDQAVTLVLTDFLGKVIDPRISSEVSGAEAVNVKEIFPQIELPGTFVLYAVPKGRPHSDFVGTPLLISVRQDERREAPPGAMVTHVSPLVYALMSTDKGDIYLAFYYDVAPNTTASFLNLAQGGFFDGTVFHRIVPGFVIQGGDPIGFDPHRGGTGGPGYNIDAEFSDRAHVEGVLSMARQGDPLEGQGAAPRSDFANSAGSQFFICLSYERTRKLDRAYTAFGRVFRGMDVVQQLGKVETDPKMQRPLNPPVIKSVKILPVDAANNPYPTLLSGATTQPSE